MTARMIQVMALLLSAVVCFAQNRSGVKTFVLLRADSGIPTGWETKYATSTIDRSGKVIYQVFWSRTEPRRELFRVSIGERVNGDELKLWRYGIVSDGDYNGDGIPDYLWYGGDDSGQDWYLFLSSGREYKCIDLVQTLEAAWTHRFHLTAPDFSSNELYALTSIALEHSPEGLFLLLRVDRLPDQVAEKEKFYDFRIKQVDFKQGKPISTE